MYTLIITVLVVNMWQTKCDIIWRALNICVRAII